MPKATASWWTGNEPFVASVWQEGDESGLGPNYFVVMTGQQNKECGDVALTDSNGCNCAGIKIRYLIAASGEERVTVPEYEIVPVQKGSYAGDWYVRWITNEYVMVGTFYPGETYDSDWVVGILNAFTGEWNNLTPGDLPNHYPGPHSPGTWAFSPDFERVLAVSRRRHDDDTPTIWTSTTWLVLWDLEKRTELWQDDKK
jgi:hypothetical protein